MTEQTANATTETPATEAAAPKYFMGLQTDGSLRAYQNADLFKADLGDATPITSVEELVASDVPLAAIVAAYNKGADKKKPGFKTREEGSKALFELLDSLSAKAAANAGKSETEKLAAAVKPAKTPKAPREKKEGTGEGRSSPLAGKFWSRSGKDLVGRRLGGTGVGINALQYIIKNPGVSTEDYLKSSGGGRLVDLQYDLDKGNIVALTGADEAARKTEIEELAKARKVAEQTAAEARAKVEADKKAKADKAAAEKKAKEEKAAADKKAKEEAAAKAEADKAAEAPAQA